MEVVIDRWGTWEELLLGGAVLRHGTNVWDVVAAELRSRAACPLSITPEVCKAKYEDLRQRYSGSGCTAWFEELRKQRMDELRQALEKSEDSIGSLESKLEGLKAEKKGDHYIRNEMSGTESLRPCQKFDTLESSSKETPKDGLSAGSYTHECQIPASDSAEEVNTKPHIQVEPEKGSSVVKLVETLPEVRIRGRRGKRKRKYCIKDFKEGTIGESELLGSTDVLSATCKESSSSASDRGNHLNRDGTTDLMEIFNSISEHKCASVFRRRLDSQKRGRYKNMILQHMDFDTIRSRIATHRITSLKELYRDLLLLSNNALVFYSKTTREYKSALLLRDVITRSLRQNCKNYITKTTIALLRTSLPVLNMPVKPRSARSVKAANVAGKKSSNAHSPPLVKHLKSSGKARKSEGHETATQRPTNLTRSRKRTRAK